MTERENSDVAIIGMSGLFAKAPDINAFWRNILDKVDAVGDPTEGWLVDESFFDVTGERKNISVYTQSGGFLNELSRFDPRPFGTMPISVVGGEPDQFLALKGSADALADAGYGSGFDSHKTGIILGHAIHANRANVGGFQHSIVVDQTIGLVKCLFPGTPKEKIEAIETLLVSKLPKLNVDTVPGLVPNMMTGRIANRLDLMGPNYIMDAACASSLIAIEAAISELRFGRADLMLAGGVNTTTSPLVYAVFCMLEALSRSSRIRPFDRSANGTLLGEGQGIFVLKRLEDALRDDDRIYAVIKAVGTSSDGRATGLMAPRLEGEVLAMKRAYEQSGVDPRTIGLVEAHGTGIPLGDRTEIQAMRQVLGDREKSYPHVALGSVKSMIGHCIPAAGAASLAKMCMAVHHKILPPTLVEEINPDLELETTPFYINTEVAPWIRPGIHPRRAVINAFGFGGVNSHMILEEAPGASDTVDPGAAFGIRPPNASSLFVFAGNSHDDLVQRIEAVKRRLDKDAPIELTRLAAETVRDARDGNHRAAIVASTADELSRKLDKVLTKLAKASTHRVRGRSGVYFTDQPIDGQIAFIFPGENSQYPGMLKDLAVSSPIVRQWFDMLERLFAGEREIPHSAMLFPPPNSIGEEGRKKLEAQLLEVDAGSEAVFFADQALFSVLSGFGVKPSYIVGHSTGENAAIIASGLTDLAREQVGRYIVEMNRIYKRLKQQDSVPEGSLLTVGALNRETVLEIIEAEGDVWFTMDNCPNQAVLFGPAQVMDNLARKLSAAGGLCMKLPLVWAYHTPFVAPMADAFAALFSEINFEEPIAQLYSCASGGAFPTDRQAILDLMKRQYTSRVRFTEVIEHLYEQGARIFVEVGPNNTLTGFVRDILRDKPHLAVAADDPKRSSYSQIQHLLAQLFVHKVPLNLSLLHPQDVAAEEEPENTGAANRAHPPLRSELPYLKLSDDEALRVRDLLGAGEQRRAAPSAAIGQGGSVPSPSVPGAGPGPERKRPSRAQHVTSSQPRAPERAPSPQQPGAAGFRDQQAASRMLSNHFQMMNEFLGQQERVASAALQRARGRSPVTTRDVSVVFGQAVPADVCLAAWSAKGADSLTPNNLASMAAAMLSAREQVTWRDKIAGCPHRRQKEWLLGRVAAKKTVQLWFARRGGFRPRMNQIEILYGENNKPLVSILGTSAERGNPPHISLSHIDGSAVAVSSAGTVGIDLESPARIRSPEGVARLTFCDAERDILRRRFGENSAEATALLWSIKEAAAKMTGAGLLGREQAVRLLDLADDARSARVDCHGTEVNVHIRHIGSLCCCVAVPG